MFRAAITPAALVLFAAACIAAVSAGCAGGSGDGPNAVISAPPFLMTPSPAPSVGVIPSSVTFSASNPTPAQVELLAPDQAYFNFSVVSDTCTQRHIASTQPSPLPSSQPSQASNIYTVTAGTHNGACSFVFEDEVSKGKGSLAVTNRSGKTTATIDR